MPDSKITALTALTAADPANDMIPIVDVSDTPPASGNTKRISINNILACSPSATLASATITGDLTVDTSTLKVDSANNRVGIGTATPTAALDILGAFGTSTAAVVIRNNSAANNSNISQVQFFTVNSFGGGEQVASIHGTNPNASANNGGALVFNTSLNGTSTTPAERYRIGNDGTATWSVAGSTAMTLNSTGLGVGVASPDFKFAVNGTQSTCSTSGSSTADGSLRIGAPGTGLVIDTGVTAASAVYGWIQARARTDYSSNFNLVLQPNGGNVGIGVASPSNRLEAQEAGTGSGLGGIVSSTATVGGNAGYVFRTGGTNRWSLSLTGSAGAESIRFYDVNNSATRLTIDSSGNVISNVTGTAPTLATNSQMVFNLTSNTNLRISVRGTDGTTRTANITLA